MKICLWDECNKETSNPKFCSLSCGTKYQRKYHDVLKKVYKPKICPQCNGKFEVSSRDNYKKYCSRSCAATANNRSRSKTTSHVCEKCDKPCRNKFCSQQCAATQRKENKVKDWLSGVWDGTSSHGLSAAIRNYLIEQSGGKCTSPNCAVTGGFSTINPVTGRCPLEVDHLDGNCYNNSINNLMVVCPNCHALTSTYRALNKNSGRAYRRNAGVA